MVSEELILKLARAIAKAEGFYVLNSVGNRAHNPGYITDEGDVGFGTVETKGPFGAKITIYPDDAAGWAALYKKIRRMLSGASHTYTLNLSVMEVALKWSGDPDWAANVAREMGVETKTTLAELVHSDLRAQGEGMDA